MIDVLTTPDLELPRATALSQPELGEDEKRGCLVRVPSVPAVEHTPPVAEIEHPITAES
jgi:hypothetical protein